MRSAVGAAGLAHQGEHSRAGAPIPIRHRTESGDVAPAGGAPHVGKLMSERPRTAPRGRIGAQRRPGVAISAEGRGNAEPAAGAVSGALAPRS